MAVVWLDSVLEVWKWFNQGQMVVVVPVRTLGFLGFVKNDFVGLKMTLILCQRLRFKKNRFDKG